MAARRPPLNRGHSMPTYPGSQSTPYGAGVETTVSSLACLNLVDTKGGTLDTKAGEILRRGLTSSASDSSKPTTPLVSYEDARAHQHLTPPHSVPSMGRGPYYQPSYFPTQPSQNLPRTKSHPGLGGGSSSYTPSSSFPIITSPTPNHSSALLRGRANSHQQSNVTMTIDSTPHQYILMAPLGPGFSSDSITIAARKENVIVIFADRWDQEQDCHHEWQVQFGRDGDMSSVHASFDNGILKITVRRLHMNARH